MWWSSLYAEDLYSSGTFLTCITMTIDVDDESLKWALQLVDSEISRLTEPCRIVYAWDGVRNANLYRIDSNDANYSIMITEGFIKHMFYGHCQSFVCQYLSSMINENYYKPHYKK